MDKEFLKENNLLDAHKHFKMLCEYTFMGSNDVLNEEGDEDDDDGNQESPVSQSAPQGQNEPGNSQVQQMGGANNQTQMPQDQQTQGTLPNSGNNQPQNDGNQTPMPDFSDSEPEEIDADDEDDGNEDEEVIDVDDLTNAQEDIESQVSDMNNKVNKLLAVINKFNALIDRNDAHIAELHKEIERRNPSNTERMNLRSMDGQPFSVSPEEYWRNNVNHVNYDVYSDNGQRTSDEIKNDEEGEYILRQSDIDNLGDLRSLVQSLSDDDEYKRNITDILDF